MSKAESMFLSISILMILVAFVLSAYDFGTKAALPVETPEVPPVEVPDYSQSLEALRANDY